MGAETIASGSGHRIALLGCGRVAQHYIKILNEYDPVDGVNIVACCDLDGGKAKQVASAFGAEAYADLDEMLKSANPEAVIVLTPSGDHGRHARAVLEAGYNVIVEKPITLDPEETASLADFAAEKGLMYGGIFQNRYNPAIVELAKAMAEGRFGKIVTAAIRLRWCRTQEYYEDAWHGTWAQDGGVANQQAIHHIDALNWICGPVEAVCSAATNRLNKLEAEDTIVAAIRFGNGALGTIEATTAARPEDFEASLSIVGEKGMAQVGGLALNRIDLWQFVEPEPGDAEIPERCSQEVPTGYGLGHGPYLRDLAGRLAAGSIEPPLSAVESIKAVEVVHALYASAERGSWVELSDQPRSTRLGVG